MTRRAASARAAAETSRRRVSSRVPNPDARASPLANAPKHRHLIEFLASTREPSRGRPHPVVPTLARQSPETIARARPSRAGTRPVAARPVVTLHDPHDPLRLRRLRRTPFAGSFPVFLGCGRHGCLFEGHDSTSTP